MTTPSARAWLVAAGFALATAPAAAANPLVVVNVNAPAYQYVFSTSGSVIVQDTVDTFAISGGAGLARLQSRTAVGQPGAPAAGLYRYSYRLDLTNVYGILSEPCVTSLTIRFGVVVSSLDYNGDGATGDQVFVITSGGLGSVGLASATRSGNDVTFNFAGGGVCAGGSPGTGESSYFFGLVSSLAPRFVTAKVADNGANTYWPQARAPQLYFLAGQDVWQGFLHSSLQRGGGSSLALSIGDVRERRFEGALAIGSRSDTAPVIVPVEGTFSADGRLRILGRSRGFVFDAEVVPDEGAPLLTGRYRVQMPGGRSEEGMLALALDERFLPAIQFEQ